MKSKNQNNFISRLTERLKKEHLSIDAFLNELSKNKERFFENPELEFECACLDPKGGELCLNKMKPGETQVEVCSDADVQIARMIWVSERKTHRTT